MKKPTGFGGLLQSRWGPGRQRSPWLLHRAGFGHEVLSSPEVVKITTRDLVRVAVFNNVGGKDGEVLRSFGEPSWNNPVVRTIDAEHKRGGKPSGQLGRVPGRAGNPSAG